MLLYVAGSYSAPIKEERQANILLAGKVAAELWDKGHAVICPHANTCEWLVPISSSEQTYENILAGDCQMLARCDGIVMLPNWARSRGALKEHKYALYLGIPVWHYPDLPDLHPAEVKFPLQCKGFSEILGRMYRTHLSKNEDYCIAPGTRVLTSNLLWTPIENLSAGTKLVGFDDEVGARIGHGQGRRMYRQAMVEAVSKVRLPSYRLTMADGAQLVSSAEHPWLVQSGSTSRWITTGQLQAQENFSWHASQIIKVTDVWEPTVDYESGYIAALDGEGWISQCRLLANLNLELGMVDLRRSIAVIRKEFIGEQDLIALRTSTHTFLAEGYATHNSPANILATAEIGLVTRLYDKVARLLNLTGFRITISEASFEAPRQPKNESIEDTLMDTAVYSIIGLLLRKGAWGK